MKRAAGIFPFLCKIRFHTRPDFRPVPVCCAVLFFFLFCLPAFASGKKDETEAPVMNNEWIFCVTEFDSSALPEDGRSVSGVFMRRLVDAIQTVNYRIRVSPEYAYYEDYAWSQARTTAAKALAAKMDERALLLYQGEPGWRYRANLKRRDDEIAQLREAYELKAAEIPLINREPVFQLSTVNTGGTFPPAPQSGAEYHFCQTQSCDAFLSGTIQDFYGRYYVTLRLYVVYADSFIYEGDVLFSADDVENAASEIAGRLTAVLAGSQPAAIAVKAQPEDTLILIDGSFGGRGSVEARELPQGKKTVTFSLEGHVPETVETELSAGELTEIDVILSPQAYADVNVTVPGKTGVSVHQGAMYVGEAPLTLRLPLNQLDYVIVSTGDGEEARAVYLSPLTAGETHTLSLKTRPVFPPGEKRVNRARYIYYWGWGGTWLTGIAAWIAYGIFSGQNAALANSTNIEFYQRAERTYYISMGAIILTGVAVAHEVFQMARYLFTATDKATPIVKTEINR